MPNTQQPPTHNEVIENFIHSFALEYDPTGDMVDVAKLLRKSLPSLLLAQKKQIEERIDKEIKWTKQEMVWDEKAKGQFAKGAYSVWNKMLSRLTAVKESLSE